MVDKKQLNRFTALCAALLDVRYEDLRTPLRDGRAKIIVTLLAHEVFEASTCDLADYYHINSKFMIHAWRELKINRELNPKIISIQNNVRVLWDNLPHLEGSKLTSVFYNE